MPWFPDYANAIALARRQDRVADLADPVAAHFDALNKGDAHALETAWPGEVVIYDPRAGEVRGHGQLRRFVRQNQSWLAERRSRIETVASAVVSGRAVVELLAHLADDGATLAWPIAVVAESPDDRSGCSAPTAANGRSTEDATGDVHPGDVVARYHAALDVGDTEAIVETFASDGYFREPIGPITATGACLNSARSSPRASALAAASVCGSAT